MKIGKAALAIVVAAAFAGTAAAQQPPSEGLFRAQNVYVGGTVGQSFYHDACTIPNCDNRDAAFRALGGLQLHRLLAVEVGYHNLGKIRAPGGTYIRSNAWEGLLVGNLPLSQRLGLYGKLGAYRGSQEGGGFFATEKLNNNGLTYGWGLQLALTRNLSLRYEWQDYPKIGGGTVFPKGDINVYSVGAIWRFQKGEEK